MWTKNMLLILFLIAMRVIGATVSAKTIQDNTGDVYHWTLSGGRWGWELSASNKPNIDITTVTAEIDQGEITISLTVAGVIEDSEDIVYGVWYNSSNAYHMMTYHNGNGTSFGMSLTGGFNVTQGNVTVSTDGSTLTTTLDLVESDGDVEFWAYSAEYTEFGASNQEWWGDWAPDTYFDGDIDEGDQGDGQQDGTEDSNGAGDGGDSKGTPGFEASSAVGAFTVIIILLRRKK